jgi:hypothetical protein
VTAGSRTGPGRPPTASLLARLLIGSLVLAATTVAAARPAAAVEAGSAAEPRQAPDAAVDWFETGMGAADALAVAELASAEVPYVGTLAVVVFTELGPRLSSVDVERDRGGIRLVDHDGRQLGRTQEAAFLRGGDQLLRVGGVERLTGTLDALVGKYDGALGTPVELDTGPAVPLELVERATGVVREVVYLDAATALIVRRETYDLTGGPVRLAAYTSLTTEATDVSMPAQEGRDLLEVEVAAADLQDLRALGFLVPEQLPRGYELLDVWSTTREDGTVRAHAVYGDGLYTLSLFQQPGRLAPAAVDGAVTLRTPDGGAVWRWPGSEPRQVVWQGGGLVFTALSDAPTDEILELVVGLPADPPPSILTRLRRGLDRMGTWLGGGRSAAAP